MFVSKGYRKKEGVCGRIQEVLYKVIIFSEVRLCMIIVGI